MKAKINIGIIGAGRIGKLHAENLVLRIPKANLISIAEKPIQIEAARNCAKKLGIPNITDDYYKILTDKEIDAVAICSSTDTHAQIIIEAAKAGKHIFCEKPIDHDLAKVDKALKAVKKAGVKLQVGFNRRFDPDFARIKQRILAGKIGDLRKIKIISRDPAPPPINYIKVSGGIFMDMTIHDFDMARFLADSEVDEIFVKGAVMVDPNIGQAGDIDTAEIILVFKNRVIATIDNCRQSADGYDQRVEAFGSKGKVFNKNRGIDNTILSSSKGEHASELQNFFLERYAESYIIEMQAFINAIINNTKIPVSGIDGKIPIIMALAAQKSHQEKRMVKLSEIKENMK